MDQANRWEMAKSIVEAAGAFFVRKKIIQSKKNPMRQALFPPKLITSFFQVPLLVVLVTFSDVNRDLHLGDQKVTNGRSWYIPFDFCSFLGESDSFRGILRGGSNLVFQVVLLNKSTIHGLSRKNDLNLP